MKLTIEYAQHIIVAVQFNQQLHWYVTEKDYWYMDLKKLEQAYMAKGLNVYQPGTYEERFHIAVLNEDTASYFLQQIASYKVSREELAEAFSEFLIKYSTAERQADPALLTEFAPALFVDFDHRLLISCFPEPASFEQFVPDGWKGEYGFFLERIPVQERYWIVEGQNYFH